MIASPTAAAKRISSHVSAAIVPTAASVRSPPTCDSDSSTCSHRNSSARSDNSANDGRSMYDTITLMNG